jgi:hypothetical protein
MVTFPYMNPVFQPGIRIITAITNGNPAVVTTSQNHLYVNGMIVRLDIPTGFGMSQANQQFGEITILTPTTFSITINTNGMDPFVVLASPAQAAISVPFAEDALQLYAAVQNIQPGGSL